MSSMRSAWPFNGLLPAPHLDALFDGGWITFEEDGSIKFSPQFQPRSATPPGWHPDMKACGINAAHLAYLEAHWSGVFRK
ncbi:MAG: hypothetical protein H6926_01800 [Chromatiales bacterium]|nr:hypothetical protein [Gammaproteobacteria bacterium]MCP5351913.1 hypothetical protein [Chromatiales bacterium]